MSRRDNVRANVARWREKQARDGYVRCDLYIPPDVFDAMLEHGIDSVGELATRLSRHFRSGGRL